MLLHHSTTYDAMDSILRHGLLPSNRGLAGPGIYFSRNWQQAIDRCQGRRRHADVVFTCQVELGNVGFAYNPRRPITERPCAGCDSVKLFDEDVYAIYRPENVMLLSAQTVQGEHLWPPVPTNEMWEYVEDAEPLWEHPAVVAQLAAAHQQAAAAWAAEPEPEPLRQESQSQAPLTQVAVPQAGHVDHYPEGRAWRSLSFWPLVLVCISLCIRYFATQSPAYASSVRQPEPFVPRAFGFAAERNDRGPYVIVRNTAETDELLGFSDSGAGGDWCKSKRAWCQSVGRHANSDFCQEC